ncbi:MAG TPA: ribosomal protein S18-alanine N-acetyltransferase [Bacteroidales bacterium]|nr:ribosomal protein S18-alanine N-acetyltransferase [Bacteroidales bacterium]
MISLKSAEKKDIREILEIENSSFSSDRFSESQFIYLLFKAKAEFKVIKINGSVRAYLILLFRNNCKGLRIYSIAVHTQARGLGLASKLLEFTDNYANKNKYTHIHLEVRADNDSAINLYQKSGFKISGKKDTFYKDGSDAIIMIKKTSST